jgi:N-formylglutamate deformylase
VQIELDRALYMDEETIRPGPNFSTFRKLLASVLAEIASIGRPDTALAAE